MLGISPRIIRCAGPWGLPRGMLPTWRGPPRGLGVYRSRMFTSAWGMHPFDLVLGKSHISKWVSLYGHQSWTHTDARH